MLHTATSLVSGRRFGEITILVPKTWPTLTFCDSATSEIQYEANFVVKRDSPLLNNKPYTLKLDAKCGTPGDVTYLSESFVKDQTYARTFGRHIGRHDSAVLVQKSEGKSRFHTLIASQDNKDHPILRLALP